MAGLRASFLNRHTPLSRGKRSAPLIGVLLLMILSPIGADDDSLAITYPEPRPWDPINSLPITYTQGLRLAWRSQTPALADMRYAAAEWGYEPIAAGPEREFQARDGIGSRVFSRAPLVYGGYAGMLFGGAYAAIGAAFPDSGSSLPFLAAGAGAELVIDNDDQGNGSKTLSGFAALSGGIAGSHPFPWAVSAKVRAGDFSDGASVEILAEAATIAIAVEGRGGYSGWFRAGAASGFRMGAGTGYPIALSLRWTANYEGRKYRGGLADGLAFAAFGSTLWTPDSGDLEFAARISAAGAHRFGDKIGLASTLGFLYDSSRTADWSWVIRLPQASSTLKGDMGLWVSLELPLLFARGRLFMSEIEGVEFFFKPYAEFLVLRDTGRAMFERKSLKGNTGLELAMNLDRDRRDVFRAGAGFDLSSWLGDGVPPSFGDLEIFALIGITL